MDSEETRKGESVLAALATVLNRLVEPRQGVPKERQLFSNRDLKALIIPLVIEQVLAMTVGMADTVMVSHAGEAAISGVSLVDMVNGVFLYVFNALGAGGAIIVSQYIGSRDLDQGRKSAGQLMMISVLLSSLFLAAVAFGNRGLLNLLFGQVSPQVMDAALTYLIITAFSYPFMAAYSACTALFRAMGLSSVTMKISLAMNILNVAGNAIGVFVLRAGVVGVAVASLVSRAAAALLMFLLLLDKKRPIFLRIQDMLRWNGRLLRRILGVAIPGGIESGLFQVCRVAMTSIIATFGAAQIAANGVALSIDNVNTIVNSAMGLALTTVIGQCVGAADYDQASYYIKKMLLMAQLGSMVVNFTVLISLPFALNLYALSPEARHYVTVLVTIHTIWTILLGTTSGPLPSAIRAAGDIRFTLLMSVCSLLIGRLFFSFVFALWLDFGIVGMWLAMGTHWSMNSFPALWRFRSGKWRNRKLV